MKDDLLFSGFCGLPLAALTGVYLFFGRYRQHTCRPLRCWRLLLGNAIVLLFMFSLLGLAGEVYFRFCYDTTDSFALTKVSKRWFERYNHANNFGVRDNQDYLLRRSPGKRRVTFIGDSFTLGQGIRDVEDRFANRIRHAHPEWEVHVIADCGLDTGQELDTLANLAKANYEFDQVVLVYCLNDIDDVIPEWSARYKTITEQCRNKRPPFLFEHSYLLNTLYYRLWISTSFPEIHDYYRCDRDAYRGAPWEAHTPRLKAIRDLVRAHGGRLCVVTFPYLHLLGPNYEFLDAHRRLDDFWRSVGVAHLDLLPLLSSHEPRDMVVNAYDAHPNEFANALAADAIDQFLKKQLQPNSGN